MSSLSSENTGAVRSAGSRGALPALSGRGASEIVRVVLEQGEACRYPVSGRSMWPFLREGDLVTIARLRAGEQALAGARCGARGEQACNALAIAHAVRHRGRNPALRAGDVVAFAHPLSERIVFHRVLRLRHDAVQTKGDNLLRSDGWIPRACLLGVVTERRRSGRILLLDHPARRRCAGAAETALAFAFGAAWPAARAVLRFPVRRVGTRACGPGPKRPSPAVRPE